MFNTDVVQPDRPGTIAKAELESHVNRGNVTPRLPDELVLLPLVAEFRLNAPGRFPVGHVRDVYADIIANRFKPLTAGAERRAIPLAFRDCEGPDLRDHRTGILPGHRRGHLDATSAAVFDDNRRQLRAGMREHPVRRRGAHLARFEVAVGYETISPRSQSST